MATMTINPAWALLSCILMAPMLTGASGPPAARFTADGRLNPPGDYREWVYLTSGLGMSYTDNPAMAGHAIFDNVFVDPAAWKTFKATGHWPDGTVFVLEARGAQSQGSINKHGQYQSGETMGVEAHVRDDKRFAGGWGFFDLSGQGPARMIPYSANCYACHQAHGAVDTTFTQFYPTAKPIAAAKGTLLDR